MLIGGLSLVAMGVVTPAWLELSRARFEHSVMAEQARRLAEQAERYAAFRAAVEAGDPVVLERLAFTQLRLKRADAVLAPVERPVTTDGSADALPPGDIDRWLRVDPPVIGRDVPAWSPASNRLNRLAGNPATRTGLVGSGALFILAGLWWGIPGSPGKRGTPSVPDTRA